MGREFITASVWVSDEEPGVDVYFSLGDEDVSCEGLFLRPIQARFMIQALTEALRLVEGGKDPSRSLCTFEIEGLSVSQSRPLDVTPPK